MKNKKKIIPWQTIGIVVFTLVFLFVLVKDFRPLKKENDLILTDDLSIKNISLEEKLPVGWKKVESDNLKTKLKLEKDSQDKIKPTIVWQEIETQAGKNQAEYVDSLIKGARSVFPSLVFTTNQPEEREDGYLRNLGGYYFNGSNKVGIKQQILAGKDKIQVLTASYLFAKQSDYSDDINKIFNDILSQ